MADFYLGSLNLEKIEEVKANAYQGRLLNVAIWVNDEPDQYGNTVSIQFGGKDEKKVYVGNAKKFESKAPF